jgi:YHS domain-containing protein
LRAKLRPPTTDERDAPAADPVCGMQVEIPTARHTSEYGKERYFFCGPGCKRAFEKEPEKYATDMDSGSRESLAALASGVGSRENQERLSRKPEAPGQIPRDVEKPG